LGLLRSGNVIYFCAMVRDKSASVGLISSLAASMCCIAPLVGAIGGFSGVASSLSWIEPARPYLIGGSILLLGLAWFQKLRLLKNDDCSCEVPGRQGILRSTRFLAIVTVLSGLIITFPSYSSVLYSSIKPSSATSKTPFSSLKTVEFSVKGMGCASCEPEVEAAVGRLSGIHTVKASAVQKNTMVQFDPNQTNIEAIRQAINSTGYTVQNVKP
jgi:mercuric ion transport protein